MTTQDQSQQAQRARLNMGLRNLAAWCEKRAGEEHDTETTLSMLARKAEELRAAVHLEGDIPAHLYCGALVRHVVTGKTVELMEQGNFAPGWACRPIDGSPMFFAHYAELVPLADDGLRAVEWHLEAELGGKWQTLAEYTDKAQSIAGLAKAKSGRHGGRCLFRVIALNEYGHPVIDQ